MNFMTSSDSDRGLVRGRFRVGYALLPKKQDSFIQDSLISLARSRGVDLLRVSPSDPLPSQGPFDCLLHKLYDHHWNSQLHTFVRDNPDALVIDPPDAIARLHNRISMLQVVSEVRIHDSDDSLGIPDQVVVYDPDDLLDGGSLRDLTFPLIAKPIVADGSAKSHEMALVFNAKGLDKLKPPIVLQQFVNHGGVIFKVYVVGEHVTCVKRKSLPDFTEESLGSLHDRDCLSFSQISNLRSEDEPGGPDDKSSGLEGMEMPPQSFLVEIANGMRNALRLNLFNFDIIRDVSCGNRYLVIDINYFPGYAKMPLYEKVLTDFFVDMARKMGKHLEDDGGSQEN